MPPKHMMNETSKGKINKKRESNAREKYENIKQIKGNP